MILIFVACLSVQLTLVCVKHVAATYHQRPVINWNGEQTLLIMCLHEKKVPKREIIFSHVNVTPCDLCIPSMETHYTNNFVFFMIIYILNTHQLSVYFF